MPDGELEYRLRRLGRAYEAQRQPRPELHATLMDGLRARRARRTRPGEWLPRVVAFGAPAAFVLVIVLASISRLEPPRTPPPAELSGTPSAAPQPLLSPLQSPFSSPAPAPGLATPSASALVSPAALAPLPAQGGPAGTLSTPTSSSSSPTSAGVIAQACAPAPDFCWIPASVTITVGGQVTWTDMSPVNHRVQSTSSNWNARGNIYGAGSGAGLPQTYGYTFTAPGRYTYICGIHTYMTGTVTVNP